MAPKSISKLARSRSPSVSLKSHDDGLQVHTINDSKCISSNSLDNGLQVHLPARSITSSKCISKLVRLWPPSASLYSLNYGLQVHLQTGAIMASKCILKVAWLAPPSLHDHGLQVHVSKLAESLPPSPSPNSVDHSLQVYLQTCTITAFKFISKLVQLRHPSASPNSHNYGLQVHLECCSITVSECISKFTRSLRPFLSSNTLDYCLPRNLQTGSIMASACIAEFTRLQCGETLELEGRQPIINTPPHLARHTKGILETELFWLGEHRMRVRGYEGIPRHDEPHKLRGSTKAWQ